jgi:hypothetical protein
MTEEEIVDQLPAGWTLLKMHKDGRIEIKSDKLNVVIGHQDWDWIKQRMTALMLSHR